METTGLNLGAMFASMVMGVPIMFEGQTHIINGLSRESGSVPCHNWIVVTHRATYYWDSLRGDFNARNATLVQS